MPEAILEADWPAPANVRCLVTTRRGGVSRGPFAGFNLGSQVEDEPAHVRHNRALLQHHLGSGVPLQWLRQVHGSEVFVLEEQEEAPPRADAIYTRRPRRAAGILTADCLPVCLCSRAGGEVAVAHAGWRGLAAGVLENTLRRFAAPAGDILAWLGPAIGPCHFEVGGEVREAFLADHPEAELAFSPAPREGKWMADLYALARQRLAAAGVSSVHGGGRCTFCEPERFYSYRRDGRTGRFATLVYLV